MKLVINSISQFSCSRFMMADNEGMRRIAYIKGMYVYAERGGFATSEAPNVGNSGLDCQCTFEPFPIRQIETAAHETTHLWLTRIGSVMYKEGFLKVPKFIQYTKGIQKKNRWVWKDNARQSHKGCGKDVKDCYATENILKPMWQSRATMLTSSTTRSNRTDWQYGKLYRWKGGLEPQKFTGQRSSVAKLIPSSSTRASTTT